MSTRRVPYDDAYATCERTFAELRIYGDRLDPAEVSQRLGIEPSSTQRQGDVRKGFRGRERVVKIGGWFLSSEGRVDSRDLRRHLDWLLAQLGPRAAELKALQATADLRMSVTCIWWSKGNGGPTLWPEQMRGLADLDLECGLEFSFYGDEDESGI